MKCPFCHQDDDRVLDTRPSDDGEAIRRLGKERICEFHLKENGSLLGKGPVNFEKVRDAINDIGYAGWMQIEGAVPPHADLVASYSANLKFLRGLFPA